MFKSECKNLIQLADRICRAISTRELRKNLGNSQQKKNSTALFSHGPEVIFKK